MNDDDVFVTFEIFDPFLLKISIFYRVILVWKWDMLTGGILLFANLLIPTDW